MKTVKIKLVKNGQALSKADLKKIKDGNDPLPDQIDNVLGGG